MPRIKPPRDEQPALSAEDRAPPTEAIEIQLDTPDDGAVEIELTPAVKPAVKPTIVDDDDALKVQIDAQKRAEELQRQLSEEQRQREHLARENQRLAAEREQERGEREDAQYNSMLTAIAAEQASLEKAESDYATAMQIQDYALAAKAQRVMSIAGSRLDRLEEGKRAFETRKDEKKPEPQPQRQAEPTFEQRIANLPTPAQNWLRDHPEYMTDAGKNRQISSAHNYITNNRGIQAFSTAYFEALDEEFGFKKKPEQLDPEPQRSTSPPKRSIPVTAPVSREVPGTSGTRQRNSITLTPEQREIARNSFGPVNGKDLTNDEKERLYANNLQKLNRMRADGTYRHTTEQTG